MRGDSVSRVVDVSPAELSAWLEPAATVEAQESFSTETVGEDDATTVVASGPGIRLLLRFEDREGAICYTREGEHGPSEMETWLETEPVDAGRTRVTIWSAAGLTAPLPLGDRIAAWNRKGELETIETDLGRGRTTGRQGTWRFRRSAVTRFSALVSPFSSVTDGRSFRLLDSVRRNKLVEENVMKTYLYRREEM